MAVNFESLIVKYKSDADPERFLAAVAPWIMEYAYRRFSADEDAIGDILVQITERIGKILASYLKEEAVPFQYFLATVVRNAYLDSIRRTKKINQRTAGYSPDAIGKEYNAPPELAPYIKTLPPEEQIVTRLYYDFPIDHVLVNMLRDNEYFSGPESDAQILEYIHHLQIQRRTARSKLQETDDRIRRLNNRREALAPEELEARLKDLRRLRAKYISFITYEDISRLLNCHRNQIKRVHDRALAQLHKKIPKEEWLAMNNEDLFITISAE